MEFEKNTYSKYQVQSPLIEVFKLSIIGTLFCYAKKGSGFFEAPLYPMKNYKE